jgi:cell division protein FtsL
MLKKILIASSIIFLFYALGALLVDYRNLYLQHKEAEEQFKKLKVEQERIDKMSYIQMVHYIAPQFNQDPNEIAQIIWNESNFKVQSHDGGRAKNITAIHDSTFKGWLPQYEKETGQTLNMQSQFDQISMMSWAFSKGYKTAWTTAVACNNENGTYSFYSRLMQKHYTVTCKPLPKELALS